MKKAIYSLAVSYRKIRS